MHLHRDFVHAFALALLSTGGSRSAQGPDVGPPAFANPPIATIDLHRHVDCSREEVKLAFSPSGRLLCAWWWPHNRTGKFSKEPVDFVIYGVQGSLVGTCRDTNGINALAQFPTVVWRRTFKDFVKDSTGWGFAPDLSRGLRLQSEGDGPYVAEMWNLRGTPKMLWTVPLPTDALDPRVVNLIQDYSTGGVALVALNPREGMALDIGKGERKRKFTFGPIESDEEAEAKRKKYDPGLSKGDPGLKFCSFVTAYEPKRGLLACGAFYDKRVRIMRLATPEKILFEANTDVPPCTPDGSRWTAYRIEFAGGGQYLLAEHLQTGDQPDPDPYPTEIFETSTWKMVWRESDPMVRAVTLSPDGTMIAFMRSNSLEICRFTLGSGKKGD